MIRFVQIQEGMVRHGSADVSDVAGGRADSGLVDHTFERTQDITLAPSRDDMIFIGSR